jgi:hypothetical protein
MATEDLLLERIDLKSLGYEDIAPAPLIPLGEDIDLRALGYEDLSGPSTSGIQKEDVEKTQTPLASGAPPIFELKRRPGETGVSTAAGQAKSRARLAGDTKEDAARRVANIQGQRTTAGFGEKSVRAGGAPISGVARYTRPGAEAPSTFSALLDATRRQRLTKSEDDELIMQGRQSLAKQLDISLEGKPPVEQVQEMFDAGVKRGAMPEKLADTLSSLYPIASSKVDNVKEARSWTAGFGAEMSDILYEPDKDDQGRIIENVGAAGIRSVFTGLDRLVVSPILEATTFESIGYDEGGTPIPRDPDDLNYKIYKFQQELWTGEEREDFEANKSRILADTSLSDEDKARQLASAQNEFFSTMKEFNEGMMGSILGSYERRQNKKTGISTGSFFRDLATDIAIGTWQGDDLAHSPLFEDYYASVGGEDLEAATFYGGMTAALLMPGFGGPAAFVQKFAKGRTALEAIADSAKAMQANRYAKVLLKELGGEDATEALKGTPHPEEVPNVMANRIAQKLLDGFQSREAKRAAAQERIVEESIDIETLSAAERAELYGFEKPTSARQQEMIELITKLDDNIRQYQGLTEVVGGQQLGARASEVWLQPKNPLHRELAASVAETLKGSEQTKFLDDLSSPVPGDLLRAQLQIFKAATDPNFEKTFVRNMLAEDLRESFVNLPGMSSGWSFVAPGLAISNRARKSPAFAGMLRNATKTLELAEDGSYKNANELARIVAPYNFELAARIKNGNIIDNVRELSEIQSAAIRNALKEGGFAGAMTRLTRNTRARESARIGFNRQSHGLRRIKDLAEIAGDTLTPGTKNVLRQFLKSGAEGNKLSKEILKRVGKMNLPEGQSAQVVKMLENIQQDLAVLPARMEEEIVQRIAMAGDDVDTGELFKQYLDEVMDEAIGQGLITTSAAAKQYLNKLFPGKLVNRGTFFNETLPNKVDDLWKKNSRDPEFIARHKLTKEDLKIATASGLGFGRYVSIAEEAIERLAWTDPAIADLLAKPLQSPFRSLLPRSLNKPARALALSATALDAQRRMAIRRNLLDSGVFMSAGSFAPPRWLESPELSLLFEARGKPSFAQVRETVELGKPGDEINEAIQSVALKTLIDLFPNQATWDSFVVRLRANIFEELMSKGFEDGGIHIYSEIERLVATSLPATVWGDTPLLAGRPRMGRSRFLDPDGHLGEAFYQNILEEARRIVEDFVPDEAITPEARAAREQEIASWREQESSLMGEAEDTQRSILDAESEIAELEKAPPDPEMELTLKEWEAKQAEQTELRDAAETQIKDAKEAIRIKKEKDAAAPGELPEEPKLEGRRGAKPGQKPKPYTPKTKHTAEKKLLRYFNRTEVKAAIKSQFDFEYTIPEEMAGRLNDTVEDAGRTQALKDILEVVPDYWIGSTKIPTEKNPKKFIQRVKDDIPRRFRANEDMESVDQARYTKEKAEYDEAVKARELYLDAQKTKLKDLEADLARSEADAKKAKEALDELGEKPPAPAQLKDDALKQAKAKLRDLRSRLREFRKDLDAHRDAEPEELAEPREVPSLSYTLGKRAKEYGRQQMKSVDRLRRMFSKGGVDEEPVMAQYRAGFEDGVVDIDLTKVYEGSKSILLDELLYETAASVADALKLQADLRPPNTAAARSSTAEVIAKAVTSLKGVALVDKEMAAAIDSLTRTGLSNNIHSTFESFAESSTSLWHALYYSAGALIENVRRSFVGGMLGGFPLPNIPYHAVNIVSQPLIAAVTLPGMALRNIGKTLTSFPVGMANTFADVFPGSKVPETISSRIARYVEDMGMVYPDGSVRAAGGGRLYTAEQIDDIATQYGLGQRDMVTMEFQTSTYEELLRAARATPDFEKMGAKSQWFNWLAPHKNNVWNTFASQTDLAFRKGVVRDALSKGYSIEEAGEMGRRALLDYSDMTDFEKKYVAKLILFYSFQRQMTMELIRGFGRKGADEVIRRTMVIQDRQQRQDEIEGYYPKYLENYLLSYTGAGFEGTVTRYGFMRVPALEAYNTMMNLFAKETSLQESAYKQWISGGVYGSAADEMFELLKDNKSPEAPHGTVPSNYLIAMRSVPGMWSMFQDRYQLQKVPSQQMRPGEVSVVERGRQVQYRFKNKEGRLVFIKDNVAARMSGTHRNIMSYLPLWGQLTGATDDMELKRFGEINPLLSATGVYKNFRTLRPVDEEANYSLQIIKQLNDIDPRAGGL